jgi:hypothetical protein
MEIDNGGGENEVMGGSDHSHIGPESESATAADKEDTN